MSSPEAPASLNEACQRFSRFLRENGYPEQILWVEKTDIVWHRRRLYVREHSMKTARDRACQRYEEGIKTGHGLLLHAFSELGEAAVAAVILPEDDDAAQ